MSDPSSEELIEKLRRRISHLESALHEEQDLWRRGAQRIQDALDSERIPEEDQRWLEENDFPGLRFCDKELGVHRPGCVSDFDDMDHNGGKK